MLCFQELFALVGKGWKSSVIAPAEQSPADQGIFRRIRQLLEEHRNEIAPRDLDLATWAVLQAMESLVHAAVITPLPRHGMAQVEQTIVDMLAGYLCAAPERAP